MHRCRTLNAENSFAEKLSDKKYSAAPEFERTSKLFTRNKVPAHGNLKILDVGCGTGVNAKYFKEMGHDVFGIDISKVAIDNFVKTGFDGMQCDILKGIPKEDNSFDLVFASEVIEHVEDYEFFLSELRRVLKKDGLLVLSTINSAFWPFRILAVLGKTLSEVQHPGHIRFFSKRTLAKSIKDAGFHSINTSARHMYLILSGRIFERLTPLLKKMTFTKEMRFKTMRPFWHLSRYAEKANSFWADTLIVTAKKEG